MVLSSASRFLNPSTVCGIAFVKSHSPSCLWASIHSGGRSPHYNAERPPSQTPAEAPTWTANVPSLDCQPNTILAVRWFSGPMGSTKQRQMFCLHDMEPFRISRSSTWNSIPAHSNSRAAFATIHMHIHWHLAYQCYNEVFGEHEHGWSQDAQAHSQCRSWSQRRLLKISWQCLFKRRYVWLVHGWHQTF